MPTNEYADLRTGLGPKNAYLPNSMDLKPRKGQKHNFWCFSAGFFDTPCILSGKSPEKSPLATPYGALKCHRQLYMSISTALTPLQHPTLAATAQPLSGPEYTFPGNCHPAWRSGSPRSQPLPGHARNSRSSSPALTPIPPTLIPQSFINSSTAPARTGQPPTYAVLSSPALPCQCNDRVNLLKLPHLD